MIDEMERGNVGTKRVRSRRRSPEVYSFHASLLNQKKSKQSSGAGREHYRTDAMAFFWRDLCECRLRRRIVAGQNAETHGPIPLQLIELERQ